MARLFIMKLHPHLHTWDNGKKGPIIQLVSNYTGKQTEPNVFYNFHILFDIQKVVTYPHQMPWFPKLLAYSPLDTRVGNMLPHSFLFQKNHHNICILKSPCIRLDLFLSKLHFQQCPYPIHLSLAMTSGKIIPNHLTTIWTLFTNNVVVVLRHKVPWPSTLELITASITPYNVAFKETTSFP